MEDNEQGQHEMDLRHLNNMSFIPYLKIKLDNKYNHRLDNQNIFSHDKDVLTYKEAYEAISDLMDDMAKESRISQSYVIDVIGLLVGMLQEKGLISNEDVDKFTSDSCYLYSKYLESIDKGEEL